MKRTPKLTRKERQAKNGIGPAQAWFPSGREYTFVSPKQVRKQNPPTVTSTPAAQATASCCPAARFRTVSKAEKKYVCRNCGTAKQG